MGVILVPIQTFENIHEGTIDVESARFLKNFAAVLFTRFVIKVVHLGRQIQYIDIECHARMILHWSFTCDYITAVVAHCQESMTTRYTGLSGPYRPTSVLWYQSLPEHRSMYP